MWTPGLGMSICMFSELGVLQVFIACLLYVHFHVVICASYQQVHMMFFIFVKKALAVYEKQNCLNCLFDLHHFPLSHWEFYFRDVLYASAIYHIFEFNDLVALFTFNFNITFDLTVIFKESPFIAFSISILSTTCCESAWF